MYVIHTKGFKPEDKISICRNYLLPELLDTFLFEKNEITFTNETILYIIEKYTHKEEGVRDLKRCLETIISKINIYYLSNQNKEDTENVNITQRLVQTPRYSKRYPITTLYHTLSCQNPRSASEFSHPYRWPELFQFVLH